METLNQRHVKVRKDCFCPFFWTVPWSRVHSIFLPLAVFTTELPIHTGLWFESSRAAVQPLGLTVGSRELGEPMQLFTFPGAPSPAAALCITKHFHGIPCLGLLISKSFGSDFLPCSLSLHFSFRSSPATVLQLPSIRGQGDLKGSHLALPQHLHE